MCSVAMEARGVPDPKVLEALAVLQESLGSAQSVKVGDLWAPYWATEGKHNDSSRDIEGRWKLYLRGHFGKMPVAKLDDVQVQKYREKRYQQTTRRDMAPSPATVNREVAVLRRLLNWAAETRRIQFNPIANVRMDKEAAPRKTKIASEEQMAQLLAHCSPLLKALCLVLYDCGLRKMEGIGLLWDDIDEANRTATVWEDRTKGERSRRIKFTSRAWEALKLLPRVSPVVFANTRVYQNGRRSKFYGMQYSPTHLYRMFLQAAAEAGLPTDGPLRVILHSLRHGFVYVNRFRRRMNEKVIMRVGGWKTRSAFDRYGDVDDEEVEDFYERVEESIECETALAKPRTGPKSAPRSESSSAPSGSVSISRKKVDTKR